MTPTLSKGKRILAYFGAISPVLYLILFFCIAGFLRNTLSLVHRGFDYSTIATKVFLAMAVIYFAQSVLILMRQRNAWVISALQAFFCFYVYEDFTALPFSNMFKMIFASSMADWDYGWIYFTNMVIISAMFSLELLKTYLIYVYTDQPPAKKKTKKTETPPAENAIEKAA